MRKTLEALDDMDELDKKASKGLASFRKEGDIKSVKASLDSSIDSLLGGDDDIEAKDEGKEKNLKWLYMIIALLGLALVGYLGYKDGSKSKQVKEPAILYAQYFEVLPDAISTNERGTEVGREVMTEGDLGMKKYNKGDYKGAASILKMQDQSDYLVYGAIAEMKNNNIKSALALLLRAQKEDVNKEYTDIIDWYLSLAYLKNGDVDNANKMLSSISSGNHYKKEEVKAILDSIK